MSGTFQSIRNLVESGDVRISEPGYDELAQDGLTARAIVDGVGDAVLVEDYPNFPKGLPTAPVVEQAGLEAWGGVMRLVFGSGLETGGGSPTPRRGWRFVTGDFLTVRTWQLPGSRVGVLLYTDWN